MRQPSGPKLVKAYRNGAVVSEIYRNKTEINGQPITRYAAEIQKRTQKEDGTWQNTNIYSLEDIQGLIDVILQTHLYLCNRQSNHANQMIPYARHESLASEID